MRKLIPILIVSGLLVWLLPAMLNFIDSPLAKNSVLKEMSTWAWFTSVILIVIYSYVARWGWADHMRKTGDESLKTHTKSFFYFWPPKKK